MKRFAGLVAMSAVFIWSQDAEAALIVDYVDDDGSAWADVNGTGGFSWNDVASVCPQDGTPCAGMLNGMDATGWVWANDAQVKSLFLEITGFTTELDDNSEGGFAPTSWGESIIDAFASTGPIAFSYHVGGKHVTTDQWPRPPSPHGKSHLAAPVYSRVRRHGPLDSL